MKTGRLFSLKTLSAMAVCQQTMKALDLKAEQCSPQIIVSINSLLKDIPSMEETIAFALLNLNGASTSIKFFLHLVYKNARINQDMKQARYERGFQVSPSKLVTLLISSYADNYGKKILIAFHAIL